jgi:hypothetical protein
MTVNALRGALVEYAIAAPPLALVFDLNPQSISRTRTLTLPTGHAPGTRGGVGFALPTETARVAQGVTVTPESFTVEILLDATDRMDGDDQIATRLGIEPELDVLRSMVEPKSQGPGGVQTLASLGLGGARAFQRHESASVLLFIWGTHVMPVFLTSVRVDEQAHLPTLIPYRATAALTMQVIESDNPFYSFEKIRQVAGAAVGTGSVQVPVIGVG